MINRVSLIVKRSLLYFKKAVVYVYYLTILYFFYDIGLDESIYDKRSFLYFFEESYR